MATFTVTRAWREGGPEGKSYLVCRGVLSIPADENVGAAAGEIPASLFGLVEILESSPILKDDNTAMFLSVPAADGGSLLVYAVGDDDFADLPDDANYILTVKGRG